MARGASSSCSVQPRERVNQRLSSKPGARGHGAPSPATSPASSATSPGVFGDVPGVVGGVPGGVFGHHVAQVGQAAGGVAAPAEHGVDGFGQLGAAGLVDAAGVDPHVDAPPLSGRRAALEDLRPSAELLPARNVVEEGEGDFFVFPRGEKDGVRRNIVAFKPVKLQRRGVQQADHPRCAGSKDSVYETSTRDQIE